LVYLAKRGLKAYKATHLVTSLSPGWEQALVKAALELKLPFTVAIPYPGRDSEWDHELRVQYLGLLARADEVYRISECYTETAMLEAHLWRVDHSDSVLALWDYDFDCTTFQVIEAGLKSGKEVVNLWQDWYHLYSMRRRAPQDYAPQPKRNGAQIFDNKH
jgi:uncharacterized phage-like protein YoqJ